MNKEITLSRRYLTKPYKSFGIFLFALILGDAINLTIVHFSGEYDFNLMFWPHLRVFYRLILIPEIFTFFALLTFLNYFHIIFRIKQINVTPSGFGIYQVKILIGMFFAFYLIIPFTFLIRSILKGTDFNLIVFINNLEFYEYNYLLTYSIPFSLVGFTAVNASLFQDILGNRLIESKKNITPKTIIFDESAIQKPEEENVVNEVINTLLKVKSENGVSELKINDIYYVQYIGNTTNRQVRIFHTEGFTQTKLSLSEIEAEFNSMNEFFRISRTVIINLYHIENVVYDSSIKKNTIIIKNIATELELSRYRAVEFKKAFSHYKSKNQVSI